MINPFYPSDFLEVLKKLSYNWTEIIKYIEISTKDDWYYVPGENIIWNLAPLYPTCSLLDLTKYFDFNSKKILSVYFTMHDTLDVGLSLNIVDKNKALKRKSAAAFADYLGPTLKMDNIGSGISIRSILHFSQEIFTEKEQSAKCWNYPKKAYKDYNECDE